MIQLLVPLVILFLSCGLLGTEASAKTLTIPAHISEKVEGLIQTELTFSVKSEAGVQLWTPHAVHFKKYQVLPTSFFGGMIHDTNYLLTFEVGVGHNMDPEIREVRDCEVFINVTNNVWGEPVIGCKPQKSPTITL